MNVPVKPRFEIKARHWYAWQMVPGYLGERCVPYCSPIYVNTVTPRHTRRGVLRLDFENVLYAAGVQDFSLDLRVLKRAADYLVAEILYESIEDLERCAVVSPIEVEWVHRFCPEVFDIRPPGDAENVSDYLDALFRRG